MIRDRYLKLLFIPLLGILIPPVSGMIVYSHYPAIEIMASVIYFSFTSFCIWIGCNWIHSKLRGFFKVINPFQKIISLCIICLLYGNSIGSISTLIWFSLSKEGFSWNALLRFNLFCSLAIIVFTLVYEILFLNKERELDSKIVYQIDRERSQAELESLRKDLDPHFIFNSLNTLNHLIVNNPPDRKSTRLNSSHSSISYAVFCLKKKKKKKKKKNKSNNQNNTNQHLINSTFRTIDSPPTYLAMLTATILIFITHKHLYPDECVVL